MSKELAAIVVTILIGLFGCDPGTTAPKPGCPTPSQVDSRSLLKQIQRGAPLTPEQKSCLP